MCVCYRRTAIEHVWQGHLEAALEARDTAHQIFRSQKDWGLYFTRVSRHYERLGFAKHSYGERPRYWPVLNKLLHLSHWRFTFWPFVSQLPHACAILATAS
jgi:hypothetical protein